jgi:phospholipase C
MKRYIAVAVTIAILAVMFMPVVSAQPPSGQSGTRTPIKHVINIFLENHSFDNLFGIYPYDRYSSNSSLSANLSAPVNLLGNNTLLNKLSEIPAGVFTTKDPNEGYVQYHIDWNHGKMNGFLNGSGPQSLTYYSAAQMAPEWDFAEQYGVADNYYAPQISESSPNHLYYLAGYSPVFNDYGPPPYVPISQSIFGELSAYNVSWGFYINNTKAPFPDWEYLYGHEAYSSHLQSWNQFLNETSNGTLPSVSYLFSQGTGDSQGPPDNILNGEEWLLYVIDSIERSPLWNSTAIFITYDEFGGYYDQVSPPVLDGVQLGFRIPLIVISPFAKEDYISGTEMTHTSLLAFIDYNWNLPALNQLVSVSNIPIDFFYFSKAASGEYITRAPVQFNASSGFPVPASIHFSPVTDTSGYNFSRIFPMIPQIPLGNLPYARNGSSHLNLSSINAGIYNTVNFGFTPFSESPLYYSLLAALEIALAGISAYVFRRRRKNGR